jgi:hypothetical protein
MLSHLLGIQNCSLGTQNRARCLSKMRRCRVLPQSHLFVIASTGVFVQALMCPPALTLAPSSFTLRAEAHPRAPGTNLPGHATGLRLLFAGAKVFTHCSAASDVHTIECTLKPVTVQLLTPQPRGGSTSPAATHTPPTKRPCACMEAVDVEVATVVAHVSGCSSSSSTCPAARPSGGPTPARAPGSPLSFEPHASPRPPVTLTQVHRAPVQVTVSVAAPALATAAGGERTHRSASHSVSCSLCPVSCIWDSSLVPSMHNLVLQAVRALGSFLGTGPQAGAPEALRQVERPSARFRAVAVAGLPQVPADLIDANSVDDESAVVLCANAPVLLLVATSGAQMARGIGTVSGVVDIGATVVVRLRPTAASAQVEVAQGTLSAAQVTAVPTEARDAPDGGEDGLPVSQEGLGMADMQVHQVRDVVRVTNMSIRGFLGASRRVAEHAGLRVCVSVQDVAMWVCAPDVRVLKGIVDALRGAGAAPRRCSAPYPVATGPPESFGVSEVVWAVKAALSRLQCTAVSVGGVTAAADVGCVSLTVQEAPEAPWLVVTRGDGGVATSGRVVVIVPVAEVRLAGASGGVSAQLATSEDGVTGHMRVTLSGRVFNSACQAWDLVVPPWVVGARLGVAAGTDSVDHDGTWGLADVAPVATFKEPANAVNGHSDEEYVPQITIECGNAFDFSVTETVFVAATAIRHVLASVVMPVATHTAPPPLPLTRTLPHPCATGDALDHPIIFRNTCGLAARAIVSLLPERTAACTHAAVAAAAADGGASPPSRAPSTPQPPDPRPPAGVHFPADAEHAIFTLRDACHPCMLRTHAGRGSSKVSAASLAWGTLDVGRCGVYIRVRGEAEGAQGADSECALGPLPLLPLLAEHSACASCMLHTADGRAARIRLTATAAIGSSRCVEVTLHTGVLLTNTLPCTVHVRGRSAAGTTVGLGKGLGVHGLASQSRTFAISAGGARYAPGWLVSTGGFELQPHQGCASPLRPLHQGHTCAVLFVAPSHCLMCALPCGTLHAPTRFGFSCIRLELGCDLRLQSVPQWPGLKGAFDVAGPRGGGGAAPWHLHGCAAWQLPPQNVPATAPAPRRHA